MKEQNERRVRMRSTRWVACLVGLCALLAVALSATSDVVVAEDAPYSRYLRDLDENKVESAELRDGRLIWATDDRQWAAVPPPASVSEPQDLPPATESDNGRSWRIRVGLAFAAFALVVAPVLAFQHNLVRSRTMGWPWGAWIWSAVIVLLPVLGPVAYLWFVKQPLRRIDLVLLGGGAVVSGAVGFIFGGLEISNSLVVVGG